MNQGEGEKIFMNTSSIKQHDMEIWKNYFNRSSSKEESLIIQCIMEQQFELLESFPRFHLDNGFHIDAKQARALIDAMDYRFDEDDPNIQEQFYLLLDKVMDGIVQLRYLDARKRFVYQSVDQINYKLLRCFRTLTLLDKDKQLRLFVDRIVFHLNDPTVWDNYYQEVYRLYELYEKEQELSSLETSKFYNDILNRQRDQFFKKEKQAMTDKLTNFLFYTKKKEASRELGAKIKKIDQYLLERNYSAMGTTEEELRDKLFGFNDYLNQLQILKKNDILISDDENFELTELFLKGKLNKESFQEIVGCANDDVTKTILNKYTQVKISYTEHVRADVCKLPELKLGYHYNNYMISSQEYYYHSLVKFISSISKDTAEDILVHKEEIKPCLPLLAFMDYFGEFDIDLMKGVLRNYPRIIRHMKSSGIINKDDVMSIASHFDKLAIIAEAYESADDIAVAALGKEVVEKIISGDNVTSKDVSGYVDVYQDMLERKYTTIPPIAGEVGNYYYESGHVADVMRLLIGKYSRASCVGLDGAGEEAYLNSLTTEDADIIMIKDKDTKEFIARTLCFRQKNFVVLAPIYGEGGLAYSLYNQEFLSTIANEMLEKAKLHKDNLEYVFLTRDAGLLERVYASYFNQNLSEPFPHADLKATAYLIGSQNNEKHPLPGIGVADYLYSIQRDSIKGKSECEDEDLTRVEALHILMTTDPYKREELARDFEVVSKNQFQEVFVGQDWYLGIDLQGNIKELLLPVSSEQQKTEVTAVRSYLQSINTDSTKVSPVKEFIKK